MRAASVNIGPRLPSGGRAAEPAGRAAPVLRRNSRCGRSAGITTLAYARAGATASEYSRCNPPKIHLARTSEATTNRWRDSDLRTVSDQ
jgi:hypothetical protein